ncbi:transmembrane protein 218-like isoform X1 [Hydractinia symbiolongicarpus]|uniref:transmembrane protein 218-like isoform X1 n=1 Tax=Hydractinia symbiolongicarpus TaxID=13093 RepID=UPI00254DE9C8|nr:transmembrane protein 218-like isoform X1 [Hydractinia symbiolongicarpus]
MGLVFGIGTGLFSLGIIWIVGIFVCLLLSRSGKQAGVFGIGFLLVLLTLVMVFYPRKEVGEVDIDQNEEVNEYLITFSTETDVGICSVDTFAIPRILYAVFITLFLLIALVAYMLDHVLMPNIAAAAKVKKTYTF